MGRNTLPFILEIVIKFSLEGAFSSTSLSVSFSPQHFLLVPTPLSSYSGVVYRFSLVVVPALGLPVPNSCIAYWYPSKSIFFAPIPVIDDHGSYLFLDCELSKPLLDLYP